MRYIFGDKHALVTGASSGLGRALSIELSKYCRKLYLTGRNYKNLQETADRCSADCEVKTITKDISSPTGVHSLVSEVGTDVDILMNVAGIFPMAPISETSNEIFQECMSLNVVAPFILSRELSKHMVQRSWGRIVNIGSSSSYSGSEVSGAYCASKHALLGLTRSLFLELRDTGVRTYFIAPGSLQTPMGKLDYRQNYNTFMKPEDVAKFTVHTISYDQEMIGEELRLNRMVIG